MKLTNKTRVPQRKRYDGVKYIKTVKDAFIEYEKEKMKTKTPFLPYKKYRDIVLLFFVLCFRKMVETSGTFQLPHNLGIIYVKGYKNNLTNNPTIDWEKSKKLGKKIPYINSHTYNWSYGITWDTKKSRFYNKKFYSFKPRRTEAARERGVGKFGLRDFIVGASKDPTIPTIFRR